MNYFEEQFKVHGKNVYRKSAFAGWSWATQKR